MKLVIKVVKKIFLEDAFKKIVDNFSKPVKNDLNMFSKKSELRSLATHFEVFLKLKLKPHSPQHVECRVIPFQLLLKQVYHI